jgi:hypothetical protein
MTIDYSRIQMTRIVRSKKIVVLIAGVFFLFSIAQSREFPQQQVMDRDLIAILSFASPDIPQEELMKLIREFRAALQSTGRFDVQPEIEMDSLLTAKQFSNIAGCNYTLCLADAGKTLGVPKVMRIDITKHGDLFATRIRIIQAFDAAILFDKVFNHSGTIDSYCRISIPEQTRALANPELGQHPSWLLPAIAIVLVSGTIYLIYSSLKSQSSSEGSGGGGNGTPQ